MRRKAEWRDTKLSWGDLLLLGVGSLWSLLLLAATNIVGIPHIERLLVLGLAVWAFAVLTARLILLFVPNRRPVIRTIFVALVLLTSGGPMVRSWGAGLAWLTVIAVTSLSAYLFVRLEGDLIADVLVAGLSVAIISAPAISLVQGIAAYGSSVVEEPPGLEITLSDRPDIWLIVVDGYPGPQSQAVDADPDGLLQTHLLESRGFNIAESAWTSYRSTNSAVPSLLEMAYPTTVESEAKATLADLYASISGDNLLRASLDANGYETVMIESGWSGSNCDGWYDVCVASAFIDDPVGFALQQSVPGESAAGLYGTPYSIGTVHAAEALERLAAEDHSAPRFVFAHLMAPHPPFMLDSDCRTVVDEGRRGYFFSIPGVSTADRNSYLQGQIDCVDRLIFDFAAHVDSSDIIVVAADHGTDRRNQLVSDPRDWTEAGIIERMNVFVATRTPSGCAIGDSFVLPNLMRKVLNCLTDQAIDEVPPRIFLGQGVELSLSEVEKLLARSVSFRLGP